MREIIEDTLSRDKEFQEQRRQRLERMKRNGMPPAMLEFEEMVSKMTVAEYKILCRQYKEEEKQKKREYAKNNSIQQSIVDEIYRRESELEYEFLLCSSSICLMRALHPLSFMSIDDFEHDLYDVFLNHAEEIYRERFSERFEEDELDDQVYL